MNCHNNINKEDVGYANTQKKLYSLPITGPVEQASLSGDLIVLPEDKVTTVSDNIPGCHTCHFLTGIPFNTGF